MKRILVFVVAFALVVAAWGVVETFAEPAISLAPETPETGSSWDPDDPLVQDAERYAASRGLELEEAVTRLQVMHAVGGLESELRAGFPETFAGLFFQHEPSFALVLQFTHPPGRALNPYVEGKRYADFVELRGATWSLAQLDASHAALRRLLDELSIPGDSAINFNANRVEIYTTNATLLQAILQEAGRILPEGVVVLQVEGVTRPRSFDGAVRELIGPDGLSFYFPQQRPTLAHMQALLEGTLVEVNGCLRVITPDYPGGFLVLWPYDFVPDVTGARVEILDGSGTAVALVGEPVRMGGGALESPAALQAYEEQIAGLPLDACPGPYWVAGEVGVGE